MAMAVERYAVIGDPVGHSLSPAMHRAAFAELGLAAGYEAVHVRPEELPAFVARARREFAGFNATVPHKEALLALVDEVDPAARAAGSVNTVSCREGRLHGASTDGHGLECALREAFGLEVAGHRLVFLGAGGTVHAVAPHLLRRGASGVTVVNRTVARAEALLARFAAEFPGAELRAVSPEDTAAVRSAIATSSVVIQATSLGLRDADPCPLGADLFLPGVCYFDTIYRSTPFLARAEACGCSWADGLGMLLHQGAASFRIWTGHEPPLDAMRRALRQARAAASPMKRKEGR